MIFREDAGFKQRFNEEVQMLENEAKGTYFVGSDMTQKQHRGRFKRLQKLVIQKEKDRKKEILEKKRQMSNSQQSNGNIRSNMKKKESAIIITK